MPLSISAARVPACRCQPLALAAVLAIVASGALLPAQVAGRPLPQLPPILPPPVIVPPVIVPPILELPGVDDPKPEAPHAPEGCASLEDGKDGGEVLWASFGVAHVEAARTADGRSVPFRIADCDGDGDLDLGIPWSEETASTPVSLKLAEVCDGGLPTSVTLVVVSDNASMRAYDRHGAIVGSSTVRPRYERQTMTVSHPAGIARVDLFGNQMCLLEVCWECPEDVPTDEPGGDPEDGCVELDRGYQEDERPLEVSFGPAIVRAARTPDGRWVPLHVDDCDGDGDLDVWLPWSETDAAPAASVDLRNVCGGPLPVEVTLVLHVDSATWHAYDARGNRVDSASVSGPRTRKAVTLRHAGGIARVDLEGYELCLLAICWSCEPSREPEVGLPQAPRFVRGDTTGEGTLDLSDGLQTLGLLFAGEHGVVCKAAADTDANGEVDLSDVLLLLGHLFLGGEPPAAPFPACGVDPDGDAVDCDAYDACDP